MLHHSWFYYISKGLGSVLYLCIEFGLQTSQMNYKNVSYIKEVELLFYSSRVIWMQYLQTVVDLNENKRHTNKFTSLHVTNIVGDIGEERRATRCIKPGR